VMKMSVRVAAASAISSRSRAHGPAVSYRRDEDVSCECRDTRPMALICTV